MPSNKTSLYDGSVHILGGELDLTGKVGLADNAWTAGATQVTIDTGTADWKAGDKVYANEATGEGRLKLVGTVSSITVNSGTAAGGDLDVTLTLEKAITITIADNSYIVQTPPKFEISAIQVIKTGAISSLIPSTNFYPGTLLSNAVTAWTSAISNDSYYGAATGAGGAVWLNTLEVDAGITIEGRWKAATITSADSCICYVTATTGKIN